MPAGKSIRRVARAGARLLPPEQRHRVRRTGGALLRRLPPQVAEEVRTHFPDEVLRTIIPRSVRVSEAPSFGQTVITYDGQSAGAVSYREAAVELVQRERLKTSDEGTS